MAGIGFIRPWAPEPRHKIAQTRGGEAVKIAMDAPELRPSLPPPSEKEASKPQEPAAPARSAHGDAGPLAAVQPRPQEEEIPAWRRNAVKMAALPREPMIAIVLDDMGPNRRGTERALGLPAPITFAFLPYAPGVAGMVRRAREAGHEILVHVPMEPLGSDDPGPHALRSGETLERLKADLGWNLDRFDGFVGINNHMGSRFTADAGGMRLVMAELKARGLMFLDSRTIANSQGARIAREFGLPTLSRDVFLDHDEEGAEVRAELDRLERLARERGSAIAIGHPHPETLERLEKWIPEAQARGFTLVPLTAILRRHEAS